MEHKTLKINDTYYSKMDSGIIPIEISPKVDFERRKRS